MTSIKEQISEILSAVIEAKSRVLLPLRKLSNSLSEDGSNKKDANVFVNTIANNEALGYLSRDEAKDLISSVAVAHQIYVNLGDYGNGEFLVLDQYAAGCYGVSVGEWLSSSESC